MDLPLKLAMTNKEKHKYENRQHQHDRLSRENGNPLVMETFFKQGIPSQAGNDDTRESPLLGMTFEREIRAGHDGKREVVLGMTVKK